MKCDWHQLGEYIEPCDERNGETFGVESVRGISINKAIIPTKADMEGVSLKPYKLLKPEEFCFVTVTSRNGGKISLACNETDETYIVSSSYEVFRVTRKDELLPMYLNMLIRRPEFDRYARFNSWGSARETFSYNDMRRVRVPVPTIDEQRRVVDAWQGLRRMKEENEQIAEPLMALCRSYMQEVKKKYPMKAIGPMMTLSDEVNEGGKVLPVVGVNFQKEFMPTAANMDGIDTSKYKVMKSGRFVFSGMQTGRDVCIRIGLWDSEDESLMSPAYTTFELKSDCGVSPEYFFLMFKRPEMDRLGWFYSDSSVRSNLDWSRFEMIKIPMPPIEVQQVVVDLYRSAKEAKRIAAEADELSRQICPALIQHVVRGGK